MIRAYYVNLNNTFSIFSKSNNYKYILLLLSIHTVNVDRKFFHCLYKKKNKDINWQLFLSIFSFDMLRCLFE